MENKKSLSFIKVIRIIGFGVAIACVINKYIGIISPNKCILKNTNDSIFDFEKFKEEYNNG